MSPGDFLIGKIKAYIKIQKLKRAVQFKTCLTSGFMLFSRGIESDQWYEMG